MSSSTDMSPSNLGSVETNTAPVETDTAPVEADTAPVEASANCSPPESTESSLGDFEKLPNELTVMIIELVASSKADIECDYRPGTEAWGAKDRSSQHLYVLRKHLALHLRSVCRGMKLLFDEILGREEVCLMQSLISLC